jgi:hypothetical protein
MAHVPDLPSRARNIPVPPLPSSLLPSPPLPPPSHTTAPQLTKRASSRYLESVQMDINAKMRAILVDWLVEVSEEYKLCADALYQVRWDTSERNRTPCEAHPHSHHHWVHHGVFAPSLVLLAPLTTRTHHPRRATGGQLHRPLPVSRGRQALAAAARRRVVHVARGQV